MEIKELTKEYFDKVANLAIISISDLPYYNHKGKSSSISEFRIEKLEEKLISENDKIFIAVEENNLLGCVWNVLDEDTLFIAWIFTDYRHRNKGVAKELLNRTIEFAKKKIATKYGVTPELIIKNQSLFLQKWDSKTLQNLRIIGMDWIIIFGKKKFKMSIGKLKKIARISFIGADMLLLVGLIFFIYYTLVIDVNLFQHILILPIIYIFCRLFWLSIYDLTLLGNSPVIIVPEKTGWKIKFYQVINIEKTSKSYLILIEIIIMILIGYTYFQIIKIVN